VAQQSGRKFIYEIAEENQDVRLDLFLTSRSIGLSRSRVQALIRSGHITTNQAPSKPSYKLKAGDVVIVSVPLADTRVLEPQAVEFEVIHEDAALIILNKPPGLVVHPAPGHFSGTLAHGLLRHCQDLSGIGGAMRPGIVHRLDKDTSGLMVVAKTDQAHACLAGQFKAGSVKKQYLALVHGRVKGSEGTIDLPIGRHPSKRKEMAVRASKGRQARTVWKKMMEFTSGFSLLSITPKTGRTHQIRVHLSHIGHPVVGDPVYGYKGDGWKRHPLYKKGLLPSVNRQMLHSARLGFTHPDGENYVEFEAPMPRDMKGALDVLKELDMGTRG
jgi:23S rRNA pseudouridine1911/1915/1917 synthase